MIRFHLNTDGDARPIDRYWEFSVGSCHAATALRQDYRRQLAECRRELGFKYLRFHGLFDDDMSVLRKSLLTDEYVVSFTNIDNIFDFLLSIDMKPFIEIGFMPDCLKSGCDTIFHYKGNITPPKDEAVWCGFIESFARHLIDRYGRDEVRSWFFEVWTEPNLDGENGFAGGRFWSGTMEDYFHLYEITARAVKRVDSRLPVGGPATSNNAHIPDMIDFCRKNDVPLDFVSTHHYPTDVVLGYGVEDSRNFVKKFNGTDMGDSEAVSKLVREYVTFQRDIWARVERGVLTDMAKRARAEAGDLPLYYTEWNSLAGLESDGPFGASFIAKTVMDNMGLARGYSYWTFSDIFEEKGMPSAAFHGGFGLMTLHGVKKATYRAYELLHRLSGERLDGALSEGTVDCYAFRDESRGTVQLLAVNHNSLLHEIKDETIQIRLDLSRPAPEADVLRVDEAHANALAQWAKLGSPEYLTDKALASLDAASRLEREKLPVTAVEGGALIEFTLPAQGVALITLYKE